MSHHRTDVEMPLTRTRRICPGTVYIFRYPENTLVGYAPKKLGSF